MSYKPSAPFNVPLYLFTPTSAQSYGVKVKTFPAKGTLFYGSFRTFGGTEVTSNGALVVEDTATIETWYRPDITAECRVSLADSPGVVYEIVGTPEDIEMRHQYCVFKVRRVTGGA